ncbi:MAG: rod shape-determining protein RodA [Anaerolineae bacterium]|nr:rod shape-determining protein RodA [Anaerolineae bacterium]
MQRAQVWRQFDFLLLAFFLVLIALGVAMIRSANLGTPDLADLWRTQATYAAVGLALFLLLALIPYTWLRQVWWAGYLLAIALLVLVLIIGESEIGDVRRWFYVGTFRFQPSFPAMLLHVVTMAAVLDEKSREHRVEMEGEAVGEPPGLLLYILSGVMAFLLAGLVFLEPDMSTAMVFIVIWIAVAFIARTRLLYFLLTAFLGLAAVVPLWQVMKPYQQERVLTFFFPTRDPGALYNINQSLISIGSGGLWGQDYGAGSQSQLHFLRVRHTDFIFSVVAEELGFIGAMLVIVLFVLLAWRMMRAAIRAPDRFGQLLVVGAGAILFFPLVVNIGMSIGLLPVTGLPLPFISYGGTSLLTSMMALGLIANVALRGR